MQKDEVVRLTLMNKNIKFLDFDYNVSFAAITNVYHVYGDNERYAPIGMKNLNSGINKISLTEWFKNRTLPKSRIGLSDYLSKYKGDYIAFISDLITKYHGVNLSDQYWFKRENDGLKWEDINYFDNDFDDTVGKSLVTRESYSSSVPSYSTNGNLYKYWKIDNNIRYLIKGGTYNKQEPFNEVIATELYSRVLDSNMYVPYTLYENDKTYFSKCPDFIDRDTEFVPAWYIIHTHKQDNRENEYNFFLRCCNNLGIPNAKDYMNKMLTCDYILGNSDRHYNNFGAIRNVNTLKFTRMSPIFDTGNSLGLSDDYSPYFKSKPFYSNPERQLELVDDLSWLDFNKLDGFLEKAKEILKSDSLMHDDDINEQIGLMRDRIDTVKEYKDKLNTKY